jgi:hypothetical protein
MLRFVSEFQAGWDFRAERALDPEVFPAVQAEAGASSTLHALMSQGELGLTR